MSLKDIRALRNRARHVKESIVQPPPMPTTGDFLEWQKRDYWYQLGKEEAYAEVLLLLDEDDENLRRWLREHFGTRQNPNRTQTGEH